MHLLLLTAVWCALHYVYWMQFVCDSLAVDWQHRISRVQYLFWNVWRQCRTHSTMLTCVSSLVHYSVGCGMLHLVTVF